MTKDGVIGAEHANAVSVSPFPDTGKILTALVLAGSRQNETDAVARYAGVCCKAFAPVAGTPMIERVVRVLLDHPRIGRIDVALPRHASLKDSSFRLAEWLRRGEIHRVNSQLSPARTVADTLSRLTDDHRLLITTADHALLNAAMLEQFLSRCEVPGIDGFAGLLPLKTLESKYPDMKRTGLKLRDGRYSGCNLFLLRAGCGAQHLLSFWLKIEAQRKTPWRMALAVGPMTLISYGLRVMTLSKSLNILGRRIGAGLAPAILDIPEAAIDVDTPGDLEFVRKLLKS